MATYRIFQDGAMVQSTDALARSARITDLAPGQSYTFTLVAVDAATNESVAQSMVVTPPDGGFPTWPDDAELVVTSRDGQTLTVMWSEAQDDQAIVEYVLYHQNVPVDRTLVGTRTLTLDGLAMDEHHVFRVEAVDAAGQMSLGGPQLMVSLADEEPPAFDADARLAANDITPRSVNLQWSLATDDIGVVAYELTVDGGEPTRMPSETVSTRVDGLEPLSQYTLELRAVDAVGQRSTPLSVSVETSDLSPPSWPENASMTIQAVSPDTATVQWTMAMGEVAHYHLGDGAVIDVIVPAEHLTQTLSNLAPETIYELSIVAVGPTGQRSVEALAVTVATAADVAPQWPNDARLEVVQVNEASAMIRWSILEPSQRVVAYQITIDGAAPIILGADVQTHHLDGLSLGVTYGVSVNAENDRGLVSADGPSVQVIPRDVTAPTFPRPRRWCLMHQRSPPSESVGQKPSTTSVSRDTASIRTMFKLRKLRRVY